MIPNRFTLIEYIRRLEDKNHVFAADPAQVNAVLKTQDGTWTDKLWQRAQAIDRDGVLQQRLQRWQQQAKWLVCVLSVVWFVLGVFSAMGLMQASALNFFYVLLSVLGMNVLMLLLWLWQLSRAQSSGLAQWGQTWLSRHQKPEQQALGEHYREQLSRPQMKWFWGKLTHQLWAASLGGLLVGMVLMLLVRQYTFNWQSTLLDSSSLGSMVTALTWLPSILGLNVPDLHTVIHSQSLGDVAFSKQWANLLWSSLLLYGVLPRAVAWVVCHVQSQKAVFELPLQLPYYQRLKRLWSTHIVDSAADYQADLPHKRPVNDTAIPAQAVLIAAWELEPSVAVWQRPEGAQWAGVIDSREEQAVLLQRLQMKPTQLHLWLRLHSMPDRGVMRRLSQYADHAQAGMTIHLWQNHEDTERLVLWQQALNQEAILWQQEGV